MAKKTSKDVIHDLTVEVGENIGKIVRNTEKTNDLLEKFLTNSNPQVSKEAEAKIEELNKQVHQQEEIIQELRNGLNNNEKKVKLKVLRSQDILAQIGTPEDLRNFSLDANIRLESFSKKGLVFFRKSNTQDWAMKQLNGAGESFNVAEIITAEDLKSNIDIEIIIISLRDDLNEESMWLSANLL